LSPLSTTNLEDYIYVWSQCDGGGGGAGLVIDHMEEKGGGT